MSNKIDITHRLKARAEDRVNSVNEDYLEPEARADYVNSLFFHALGLHEPSDMIEQPLYWDLVSFSIHFIGHWAQVSQSEDIINLVRAINSYFYSMHYGFDSNHPALGPGVEAHRKIWKDRLEKLTTFMEKEETE